MSSEMSPESTPVLTPHARFYRSGNGYVLITPDADFNFYGRGAEVFDRVKYLLNGSRDLSALSEVAGVPLAELAAVCETLSEEGALRDVTPLLSARTPEQFLGPYFRLCDEWALNIFSSPLWETMMGGNASPPIVFGWGIEFYHRVVGADEHIGLAVDYCRDETIRRWLSAHFSEEADHSLMFLAGLAQSGFARQRVIEAPPLPCTRALINYLNVLAATDLMAYLGCYGVMHSPRYEQTRERVDQQYALLKQHYSFASGMLDKIHEHAVIDLDLGHEEITLERVLKRRGEIDRDTAVNILGAVRGIVTAFVNFFDGIYEYYRSPDVQLPRSSQAVRLRAAH